MSSHSIAERVDDFNAAWREMTHSAGGYLEAMRQRSGGNEQTGTLMPAVSSE